MEGNSISLHPEDELINFHSTPTSSSNTQLPQSSTSNTTTNAPNPINFNTTINAPAAPSLNTTTTPAPLIMPNQHPQTAAEFAQSSFQAFNMVLSLITGLNQKQIELGASLKEVKDILYELKFNKGIEEDKVEKIIGLLGNPTDKEGNPGSITADLKFSQSMAKASLQSLWKLENFHGIKEPGPFTKFLSKNSDPEMSDARVLIHNNKKRQKPEPATPERTNSPSPIRSPERQRSRNQHHSDNDYNTHEGDVGPNNAQHNNGRGRFQAVQGNSNYNDDNGNNQDDYYDHNGTDYDDYGQENYYGDGDQEDANHHQNGHNNGQDCIPHIRMVRKLLSSKFYSKYNRSDDRKKARRFNSDIDFMSRKIWDKILANESNFPQPRKHLIATILSPTANQVNKWLAINGHRHDKNISSTEVFYREMRDWEIDDIFFKRVSDDLR